MYTVQASRGLTVFDILVKSLDLFTIVIPPALPAAMTVGRLYALRRLQKHHLSCMNTRVINVCGSIDCICFDKVRLLTIKTKFTNLNYNICLNTDRNIDRRWLGHVGGSTR